jgi:putative membrane protein
MPPRRRRNKRAHFARSVRPDAQGTIFFFHMGDGGTMKRFIHLHILAIAGSLALLSCSDSRRGSDAYFKDDADEAAAVSNTEKFNEKKQRDADFVFKTVANQYGEIKLTELAVQRSHNPEVKRIAERFHKDHAASLNELKTLAQARSMSVPVEETDNAKNTLERFADESGKEFDKKWCKEMIDMHDQRIDEAEKRLQDTEDAELRTYLNKTLPILREHATSLKACYEKIRNKV